MLHIDMRQSVNTLLGVPCLKFYLKNFVIEEVTLFINAAGLGALLFSFSFSKVLRINTFFYS